MRLYYNNGKIILKRVRRGHWKGKLLKEIKAVGHPVRGAIDLSRRKALVAGVTEETDDKIMAKRARRGHCKGTLLTEMKAVGHPLRGASDLSQMQTPASMGDEIKRTTK